MKNIDILNQFFNSGECHNLEAQRAWFYLREEQEEAFAKCAEDILTLDCADAVINKQGVLFSILKRHFT